MTMFRPKKKRSKPSFLRSKEAESDEEEEKIAIVKKSKPKKRKISIRSFEDDSEPAAAASQTLNGIGFGGAAHNLEETEDTTNAYSSDALSRLKAEQSVKPAVPSDTQDDKQQAELNVLAHIRLPRGSRTDAASPILWARINARADP